MPQAFLETSRQAGHILLDDEKDSYNTGNFIPYSSWMVCGFFNVPHWNYKPGRYLLDGTYSFYTLFEKTCKPNHMRM